MSEAITPFAVTMQHILTSRSWVGLGAPALGFMIAEWQYELSIRLNALQAARDETNDDMNYGGAAAASWHTEPLQQAVDEAKNKVAQLQGLQKKLIDGGIPNCVRVKDALTPVDIWSPL